MAVDPDIVVSESSHVSDASSSSSNSLSLGSAIVVPTIENVVSTVNLGCKLDLKAIAVRAPNTKYNPQKFAALMMRIKEPKATALIFSSGKMVCTGAKTEQESRLAAHKHARIIQKLGFDVKFKDFKIQNMVASYDFECPLNLTRLAYSHNDELSLYEPELFPGLVYRMKQLKTVVLIFSSGKIAIGGAQKRDELFKTFEKVYPILKTFKVDQAKESLKKII